MPTWRILINLAEIQRSGIFKLRTKPVAYDHVRYDRKCEHRYDVRVNSDVNWHANSDADKIK